jgi:hypothetical protein
MSRNVKISAAIVVALVLGIAALAIAMDAPPEEQESSPPPTPQVVTADRAPRQGCARPRHQGSRQRPPGSEPGANGRPAAV